MAQVRSYEKLVAEEDIASRQLGEKEDHLLSLKRYEMHLMSEYGEAVSHVRGLFERATNQSSVLFYEELFSQMHQTNCQIEESFSNQRDSLQKEINELEGRIEKLRREKQKLLLEGEEKEKERCHR